MKLSFPHKYDPEKYARCNNVNNVNNVRVRTHQSTSEAAVRRLGRIIQRFFLPNQKAAHAEPFENGLVRVGNDPQ